jgi:folylpolyglutamate synthase
VPNQSQYNKLGSHALPPSKREQIDLSWQLSLQRHWESLPHSNQGCYKLHCYIVFICYYVASYWNNRALSWRFDIWAYFYGNGAGLNDSNSSSTSLVFESLPLAIKWLREIAQENQSTQFQVCFTLCGFACMHKFVYFFLLLNYLELLSPLLSVFVIHWFCYFI